jgi:hypothetical protein
MIYIDFQGGSHGNYLEFVCNKFLANVETNGDPFNDLGASHSKKYLSDKEFEAWHYFDYRGITTLINNSKIISVQITTEDVLLLSAIGFLRAGDQNIDIDQLEINTYNKLNNDNAQELLHNLVSSFFQNQIQQSYNAVKDPGWPDVNSLEDFKNLPNWIQQECETQHKLKLLELTNISPDCPRYVLREFFKIAFTHPDQCGFMVQQQKMKYDQSNDVYIFPYRSFYDTELFIIEVEKLSNWTGYNFSANDDFLNLHAKFLNLQPYKDSKKICDTMITKIISKELFDFPKLNLLQESYLTAKLELHYNIQLPNNNKWFLNSQEIMECIES